MVTCQNLAQRLNSMALGLARIAYLLIVAILLCYCPVQYFYALFTADKT